MLTRGFSRISSVGVNCFSRSLVTKAVRIYETGGSDVLKTEEYELPSLKDGEILISNEFAGLNFIDTYQRSGLYKISLPSTLGVDGSGIIKEVTPLANKKYNLNIGDRISYYDLGSYSKYKILDGSKAIPVLDNVSLSDATACVVQGMTAHYLSRSTYCLKENDWCVIHAAAGGVGQFLVQIAKIFGANVIGTVSNDIKKEIAYNCGCDYVCKYNELYDLVKSITPLGNGVNVVYDGVGKSTYEISLQVLKTRGMCVLYGNASGAVPPINPLELSKNGSLFLTRPILAHHTLTRDELLWRSNEIFNWISNNLIKIKIDNILTLDDIIQAHKYIEEGKTMGKIVFKID